MRLLAFLVALSAACSTPDESSCVPVDTSCTPQYEPTFANIHARTLTPSCATGDTSCHASSTSLGGFSMTDIDDAYAGLTLFADDCGVLQSRITSDSPGFQMPPGSPLSDAEQCAILLWVEAGAPR